MNITSPRNIALFTSLLVSVLVLIASLGTFYLLQDTLALLSSLIIAALAFVMCYFILFQLIEKFINNKIRLIYKTIHNLKIQKGQEIRLDMKDDILKKVNRDVMDWADSQKKEIRKLREKETFRREFIGNLSHELKTPIFSIQGYLLTLLEGGLDDPKISTTFLERAGKSVERMVSLLEDLDSIAQLESGEIKLSMERFDIVPVAGAVLESLEIKAQKRNVQLKFSQKYDKPIFVIADPKRIEQVLSNLVVNSINYGKENGETEIRFFDMDEHILVEVADNGLGISKESLPRVFERFYRVDKSRSRDVGGSGLGLAICKHIIDAHKETINVRSTEGVGSTFSFTVKKA